MPIELKVMMTGFISMLLSVVPLVLIPSKSHNVLSAVITLSLLFGGALSVVVSLICLIWS